MGPLGPKKRDERVRLAAARLVNSYVLVGGGEHLQSRGTPRDRCIHSSKTLIISRSGKTAVPRLSIVIPCAEEAREFETTLASVLQNRPDDCEVLVVQPRPYHDPYGLKDEVRFVEAPALCDLVDLVNVAMECATAELVNVLSCDLEVTDGWLNPALSHFEDAAVGSVSPLIVLKSKARQVVARGVHYSRGGVRQVLGGSARRSHCRAIVSPTFAAGVYRRSAVLAAGGFCVALSSSYADVDLGLTLRAAGYRCVHEAALCSDL